MLIMVEKWMRCGICYAIHPYTTVKNKYIKNYNQNKQRWYLMYRDENNLYGWIMLQKLLVDGFKWRNYKSDFDEIFIDSYDEDTNKRYILEVDVE